MRRRALTAVVALALLVAGCGDIGQTPPELPAGADAELRAGAEVYARSCARCHGSAGAGGAGPAIDGGRMVERFEDPAELARLIRDGRGRMPAFGATLDDDEIDAVVRYTREVL